MRGHIFGQRLDQRGDVGTAFAQGWDTQWQHVQPVKQVFTELASAHQCREVPRGGGDHAGVKGDDTVGAQRLNLALLQGAQEFGLQGQRHIADFVQKQRAAIGEFEFAVAPFALSTGESAGRNTEKFGLQKCIGHGGDIDADQGATGAFGRGVNGMRQEFFARPGFAQQ